MPQIRHCWPENKAVRQNGKRQEGSFFLIEDVLTEIYGIPLFKFNPILATIPRLLCPEQLWSRLCDSNVGAHFVRCLDCWAVALLFSSPLYPCPKRLVKNSTIPIVLITFEKGGHSRLARYIRQRLLVRGSIGSLVRKEFLLSILP